MRKNQKYSKGQMYRAIKKWEKSGLTQVKFCKQEQLSPKAFCYWLRKYRSENATSVPFANKEAFIPVSLPGRGNMQAPFPPGGRIELFFPNGVRLNCPAGIEIHQLKALIKF
jgi:hypothetical protein